MTVYNATHEVYHSFWVVQDHLDNPCTEVFGSGLDGVGEIIQGRPVEPGAVLKTLASVQLHWRPMIASNDYTCELGGSSTM